MVKIPKPNPFQVGDIVTFGSSKAWIYVVTDIVDNRNVKCVAIDDSGGMYIAREWEQRTCDYPYRSVELNLVWRYEND